MNETALDEAVKPAPYATPAQVASVAASAGSSPSQAAELLEAKKPHLDADPTSDLPSSPPQIYLNLLILEASLRSQYLTLRARRRQHVFFLALLALWIAYFLWTLFLRPREDGQGLGGSVYWVVDMAEKVACMGGIMTALLIWATGQWERGVRWPRRWVGVTNRGLRGMNLKIVVLKGSWWRRLGGSIATLFPYRVFLHNPGSEFHVIEVPEKRREADGNNYAYRDGYKRHGAREEDIAPGGDTIKLLLLPKHFSPEFRENWELYRAEYWDKENERRATLAKVVRARHREEARQRGGWLWWTGYRGFGSKAARPHDVEKSASHHHHPRESKSSRRMSTALSHSRSSSRSTTPGPDADDARKQRKSRLGSVAGSTRHAKSASRTQELQMTADGDAVKREDDPKARVLHKRASTLSNASNASNASDDSVEGQSDRRRATSLQRKSRTRDLMMSDVSDA